MTTGVKKLRISDNVKRQTAPRILVQEADGSVGYVAKDSIGSGSGIGGTLYSYVAGKGTPTENATELQNAYNLAKTIVGLSATNRYKIIVGTGKYQFASLFVVDTQFIDIVSLSGNADVEVIGGVSVTANDVYLRGILTNQQFRLANNLSLLVCEKCTGLGQNSFGHLSNNVSGTFIDCVGGQNSFGATFTGTGNASGTFTRCRAIASFSFGGLATEALCSGVFTNCIGIYNSFSGGSGTASGTFYNCVGGTSSFGNGTASGTFYNCVGGTGSFGNDAASGTFYNCVGGSNSFGGTSIISGKLFYCRLTFGTFKTVSSGGRTYYCVDGNGNTNNQ